MLSSVRLGWYTLGYVLLDLDALGWIGLGLCRLG
jgi:hypothetical protein